MRRPQPTMYDAYYAPTSLTDALAIKASHGERARFVAGGTDLLIEIDRGQRQPPNGGHFVLIDLTRIPGLAEIEERNGQIHLGPLVTHNGCVASRLIVEKAFPLARACWEVGAPQIRNRATVVGNIVTASPANDTIVPLMALEATVTLASAERGERTLPLADFMVDFRRVDLAPDEMVVRISFSPATDAWRGGFLKLGLRRVQAISVVSAAALIRREPTGSTDGADRIGAARISLGAVAPTVVRAAAAERFLVGRILDDTSIDEAAQLAMDAANPIDDVRGSGSYRRNMVRTLVARLLHQIREERERAGWSANPVMLWGDSGGKWPVQASGDQACENEQSPVEKLLPAQPAQVNGQPLVLDPQMTLLDSLRAAGLLGTKEGCAEGECGACTVFLDGMAVMACLVPAERASGSVVTTIEALSKDEHLHAVQEALVRSGGVQCGYCTPGFVMSAAKLLEERPHPSRAEAREAFAGNLCRCTGYRKILDAVVQAGE